MESGTCLLWALDWTSSHRLNIVYPDISQLAGRDSGNTMVARRFHANSLTFLRTPHDISKSPGLKRTN